jgi:hypothetical protein
VPVAATTNTPEFPTVTVSLAGFDVIDGAEVVGVGGSGDEGGTFTVLTKPVQPERNNTGSKRSVKRCKILAQRGRGFGSRGEGCLLNKKIHPEIFRAGVVNCTQEAKARQATRVLIFGNISAVPVEKLALNKCAISYQSVLYPKY